MKLISYLNHSRQERAGLWVDDKAFDLQEAGKSLQIELPQTILEFLDGGEHLLERAARLQDAAREGRVQGIKGDYTLISPVPHPRSCRDAYAFRQHVAAARRNRGMEMIPEFDQFPIFYYTNHNAIIGGGDLVVEKDHLEQLDFELEVAVVIGKKGKNIPSEKADAYIAGYVIMNDFSARKLQMEEMKLSLGPAKGKDFATALGPWLVTMDELEKYKVQAPFGRKHDLKMAARHNGKDVSHGNLKDMDWTFAEIIERVSYGVDIFPGDVIGSGTVGTGCYMELNGTWALEAKEKGKTFDPVWLKVGDEIELEVTGLGLLKNKVVRSANQTSLFAKKKNAK